MALGILSDEEFEKEISKISPIIRTPSHGRSPGDKNVPDSIRKIIGDTAQESGRKDAVELASFLGLSESSASAYANGATSTASYNQGGEFKDYISRTRAKVTKRAAKNLNRALTNMTEEKFEKATLTELASVAKAMSGTIRDMEPPTEVSEGPKVQFVIHAPQLSREDKFPIIDVTE